MKFRKQLILLFFFAVILLHAQENNTHHIIMDVKSKDTNCLKDCFIRANWEAHTRSFFMSTINEGSLKDDYALGSGAGIGILTKPFYGLQAGLSGFFIYNLLSSDLGALDSLTLNPNRYEIGLFDLENPHNKHDLDRLEELFLKYTLSKTSITVGKININTPFMNPQDGRMRPTIEEGVWLNILESKKIGLSGGWIWDISPRSTTRWYTIEKSIGLYPSGVNVNGSKSNYYNNIESAGMAIANIYYNPSKHLKINIWDGMLDNVMNTSMIEINSTESIKDDKFKLYQGLMFMHQDAINHGGNTDQSKTYFNENSRSNIISAQLGVKTKKVNTSINYTHITGDGRYLMPREWGRDPFYTFLPRERNEGLGNVHAFMTKTQLLLYKNKLKTSLGLGYYKLPDVKDFRLNKYGMPSYYHINYDASYTFDRFLKGMELRMLVTYKINNGNTYDNLKYIYNKVNMVNFNIILDFKI